MASSNCADCCSVHNRRGTGPVGCHSPPGCDAGIGGVGWQNETVVLFAMDCGDEPAAVYAANREDTSRDRARMLKVSRNPEPVRGLTLRLGESGLEVAARGLSLERVERTEGDGTFTYLTFDLTTTGEIEVWR